MHNSITILTVKFLPGTSFITVFSNLIFVLLLLCYCIEKNGFEALVVGTREWGVGKFPRIFQEIPEISRKFPG